MIKGKQVKAPFIPATEAAPGQEGFLPAPLAGKAGRVWTSDGQWVDPSSWPVAGALAGASPRVLTDLVWVAGAEPVTLPVSALPFRVKDQDEADKLAIYILQLATKWLCGTRLPEVISGCAGGPVFSSLASVLGFQGVPAFGTSIPATEPNLQPDLAGSILTIPFASDGSNGYTLSLSPRALDATSGVCIGFSVNTVRDGLTFLSPVNGNLPKANKHPGPDINPGLYRPINANNALLLPVWARVAANQ